MDPLSIISGVIAVATTAAEVSSTLSDLRRLCKQLPGRLHALNNEVSDIEVVLYQVAKVVEKRSCSLIPTTKTDRDTIPQILKKAKTKLTELKEIIDRISSATTRGSVALFRAGLWRKEQPKLQALQEDIKAIKSNLNVILGASNSYEHPTAFCSTTPLSTFRRDIKLCFRTNSVTRQEMMRVRLHLETFSTISAKTAQEQTASLDEFLRGVTSHQQVVKEALDQTYQQVDQRISRVEEMLKAQSAQIQASQFAQVGPYYNMGPPSSRRRLSRAVSKDRVPRMPARSEAVGVRLTQYATVCRPGCLCTCHSQTKSTTPRFLNQMLGQLFVGYTGIPIFSPRCDTATCDKAQSPRVSFEYWFPLGVCWSQIVRLQLTYQSNIGPQLSLSTLRRVPDSAQCVSFALEGNIDGLKNLFKQGLASPRDISTTRGYSILRVSLHFI